MTDAVTGRCADCGRVTGVDEWDLCYVCRKISDQDTIGSKREDCPTNRPIRKSVGEG